MSIWLDTANYKAHITTEEHICQAVNGNFFMIALRFAMEKHQPKILRRSKTKKAQTTK